MSRENVELVRQGTDAANSRDIDGMLENWAPDAVLDWSNARSFDAGVYRGHDEIRAFMERFLAAWLTTIRGDKTTSPESPAASRASCFVWESVSARSPRAARREGLPRSGGGEGVLA